MDYNIKRDIRIDILRTVAILCILLAHSNPPEFIFQLRNFDVTLMTLLMGVSFYLSSQKHSNIQYYSYIKKRFYRLILPTWKFLIVFFTFFSSVSFLLKDKYYFSLKQVLNSFTLINGIGFVWIMRVFFIVAIFSPLLLWISNSIKRNSIYFLALLLLSIFYGLLLVIYYKLPESTIKIFYEATIEGYAYSLIAAIGIRLYRLSKKQLALISFLFLGLFIILFFHHEFAQTQAYKYPPTLYYFSYGIFVSIFLFLTLTVKKSKNFFNKYPIIWMSKQSLNLYFAHIVPAYIIILFGRNMPINNNFVTRFLFLLIGGLVLVILYNHLMRLIRTYFENKIY